MSILIGFLTVLEVIVCLLLILLILMQRPRQEGLGATFAADAMSNLYGTQATNVLQKGTTWLAAVLFGTTILLGVLVAKNQSRNVDIKLVEEPAAVKPVTADPKAATPAPGAAATPAPGAPAAPANITVTPAGATSAPIKVETKPATPGAAAPTIKVEPTKPASAPAAPTIKVEPKPAASAPVIKVEPKPAATTPAAPAPVK